MRYTKMHKCFVGLINLAQDLIWNSLFSLGKLIVLAQGYLARDNFEIKFFKLNSWSPGADYFPIAIKNLLSLKMI